MRIRSVISSKRKHFFQQDGATAHTIHRVRDMSGIGGEEVGKIFSFPVFKTVLNMLV